MEETDNETMETLKK